MTKVYPPSALRRGRLATKPAWLASHNGRVLQFWRKRDADLYEKRGCSDHLRVFCECHGLPPTVRYETGGSP